MDSEEEIIQQNNEKIQNCNIFEIFVKVMESGIGLDSNPMDVFIACAEELNLKFSKNDLKRLHQIRNHMEEEVN